MDEHTLNDLLECSVCLDRLDTSSKVLPCQHTFCRKCLEVIISSHNELRCPECRILVDIKIDELPPNVLLMRILEGMKQAATLAGKTQETDNKQQEEKQKSANDQINKNQHKQQPPQQQQQQQNQQQPRRCLLPHAYALYDFVTTETTDLNFKKGDLILLKRRIDSNWFVGQSNGKEGTFPINYVQVIVPLPAPQCIALYDFKMGPNEEEGCLNFKKGTVIHVLRRVDHNWAEGRIGTTIGIFPIAFVELNYLAKQLLDSYVIINKNTTAGSSSPPQQQQTSQQPINTAQTVGSVSTRSTKAQQQQTTPRILPPVPLVDPTESNSSTSTSNATSPSTASSTSSSSNCSPHQSLPNTPQHRSSTGHSSVRYREKGAKEKRHSLNALLAASSNGQAPTLSLMQTNRHSAEILSLPHELNISSNNSQNTTSSSRSRSVGNEIDQQSSIPVTTEQQVTCTQQQQQQQKTTATIASPRVNVLKSGVQQNVPPTLPWGYLALYPYKPRKGDELELKKGCVYIVTERCLDGWFKGKNWQDISGVFPGNYVTPLRTRDQQQLMHQWKYIPQTSYNSNSYTAATMNCPPEQATNMKISSLLPHQPPDLPPRLIATQSTTSNNSNTTTTTCSVWTKPLGQTVEAFFNRNKTNSGTLSNVQLNNEAKEKQEKPRDVSANVSSTTSGGAVGGLMKRFSNIKSRSKSPGSQLQQQNRTDKVDDEMKIAQLHPVHVRSGSCPSQLLQSLPNELPASNQRSENVHLPQAPSIPTTNITYGSQRIKSSKERPQLVCARQSLDAATFRNIFSNNTSASTPIPPPPITTSYAQHVVNPPTQPQSQNQQQHLMASSQLHANMILSPHHRKSQSLDAGNMLSTCSSASNSIGGGVTINLSNSIAAAPPPPLPPVSCGISEAAIKASATTKSTQCSRECRFRCVVPYPPNSDIELELHVGDIIFVQRHQKNGWYKGTHARTNKTGLFPASFVEPDI